MSPDFNKGRFPLLGHAGTASLEFALVAIPFVFLLIAGMDLGRYFITQHSIRTLSSEAVRSIFIYCYGSTSTCQLPLIKQQALEAKVPFLAQGSIVLNPPPAQTAPDSNGIRTITVGVQYPFTFVLPVWTGLNGTISETTSFQY
jgi:hypothetical protein